MCDAGGGACRQPLRFTGGVCVRVLRSWCGTTRRGAKTKNKKTWGGKKKGVEKLRLQKKVLVKKSAREKGLRLLTVISGVSQGRWDFHGVSRGFCGFCGLVEKV